MAYYFSVNIKINDENEYQKYLEKADGVFSKFGGEYLAVDTNPKIVEGEWKYSRAVLIKFNSKNDFEDWYYSDSYQQILKHRLAASDCDSILLKGADRN